MKRLILTIFTIILGLSVGLKVGPVRLPGNLRYMSYNLGASENNSLLECPYTLKSEETVQKISWILWKEDQNSTYEWTPEGGGHATGLLEGVVKLDRADGKLELTELNYDLGGYYSCEVALEDGQSMEAARWEFPVIDRTTGTSKRYTSGDHTNCVFTSSFESYAVYPEPTIHSGMWSHTLGGFYEEVPAFEWHKILHSNKSVTYSYDNHEFKIDEHTPHDAVFLTTIGVTKSNGNYISLEAFKDYDHLWQERGCRSARHQEYQVVTYSPDSHETCRMERTPSANAKLTGTVTCAEGSHAAAGGVDRVFAICNMTTYKWQTEEGQTPRRGDLKCVIDEISGNNRILRDPIDEYEVDDDTGSTTANISSPWLLAILLMCLLHHHHQ